MKRRVEKMNPRRIDEWKGKILKDHINDFDIEEYKPLKPRE